MLSFPARFGLAGFVALFACVGKLSQILYGLLLLFGQCRGIESELRDLDGFNRSFFSEAHKESLSFWHALGQLGEKQPFFYLDLRSYVYLDGFLCVH